MTLRQWMVGISLTGAIGFAVLEAHALAKPPDLPVDQGVFCLDKEAMEILCGSDSSLLLPQHCQQVALGGATRAGARHTGDDQSGLTRAQQFVSMAIGLSFAMAHLRRSHCF